MLITFLVLLLTPLALSGRSTTCYRAQKNPIPAGVRCGQYGTLTSPKNLRTAVRLLSTVENCRDECMNDVTCQAFSVNAAQKYCRLYTGTLSAMGFKTGPASGQFKYYERSCYTTDCDTFISTTVTPSSSTPLDDQSYQIDLPFPIRMYGKSTTKVWMSINGVLSFSAPGAISTRQDLPAYSTLPDVSVCVFWTDAIIQPRDQRADQFEDQEMSWEYRNDFLSPIIYFHWKVRYPYNSPTSYLEAQIYWSADADGPGIFTYPSVGPDRGNSATIGSQCTSCNSYSQYTDGIDRYNNILWDPVNRVWYNPF